MRARSSLAAVAEAEARRAPRARPVRVAAVVVLAVRSISFSTRRMLGQAKLSQSARGERRGRLPRPTMVLVASVETVGPPRSVLMWLVALALGAKMGAACSLGRQAALGHLLSLLALVGRVRRRVAFFLCLAREVMSAVVLVGALARLPTPTFRPSTVATALRGQAERVAALPPLAVLALLAQE
ncbi:MAG: hypothetical protein WD042_03100 [Phycisphaeraceae bacterium]